MSLIQSLSPPLASPQPRKHVPQHHTSFPRGATLNVKFSLALTGKEISTGCEVRHSLPGVGLGVEFIGISPEVVHAIEGEIKLCGHSAPRHHLVKKK